MKFIDRYKISLHNIKNNKSRSILTTIIVFIISILMTFILSIAISFSMNVNDIMATYYQTSGEIITTNVNYYTEQNSIQLNSSKYVEIKEVLNKHSEVISYTDYSLNIRNSISVQNHEYPNTNAIEIIEGENANASYVNTNKVLVSAEFARKYYENYKENLKLNDKFSYNIECYACGTIPIELEIIGFYKTVDTEGEYNQISISNELIMDIEYLLSLSNDLKIESIDYYYNPPMVNFNKDEFSTSLSSFVSDLNKVIPKSGNYNSVFCSASSEIAATNIISIVVVGLAVFLCLVLILLSIGSLANTIMISVDKNKKFIGLLKALGLNEGDLKSTIRMESITTITLGVLLAFLVVYLFKNVISQFNDIIINSMFSYYLTKIDYTIVYALPIYIPIIVLAFFIVFTLLFARGSMTKIAKTDPMAVISEVA